jgi:hypothetical protein
VAEVMVADVPASLAAVPACVTRACRAVSRAAAFTGVVVPGGRVTVRMMAPVGGGGGGEQQSSATPTAPPKAPGQANDLGPPVKPDRDRVLPQMIPALVTRVVIWLLSVAAVVSAGVWLLKTSWESEPVAVVLVAEGARKSADVPAWATRAFRTAFRAAALTGAVLPGGRLTVSSRAAVGGGGAGDGEGLGGGEQHRTSTPAAPATDPGQA